MKRYWNNKVKIIISYKLLALCSMLCAGILLCWLLYPDRASSGPYLDSAHGNYTPSPGYGVNRSGLSSFNYSVGNCAHCHEQHASIGGSEPAPIGGAPSKYELFQDLFSNQSTTFCYGCHIGPADATQYQISMPNQYNYSRMATGDTTFICPGHIRQAFRHLLDSGAPRLTWCGSSNGSAHFLADIRTLLTSKGSTWNFSSTAGDNNPCSGCHNPHRAKRDPYTVTGRISADGKLVSSVSKPSQHSKDNNVWRLWGEESNERMSNYTTYQPPCRYPWANPCTSFEPDGYSASDASRTVDYVAFCLDCHVNQVSSTYRGNLKAIDWTSTGDVHGARPPTGCNWGDKKAPYADGTNYVLSCLDCHEPHGSPNGFLLRREVNGKQVTNFTTGITRDNLNYFYEFCTACHTNIGHVGPANDCTQICHHYHSGTPAMNPCSPTKMF